MTEMTNQDFVDSFLDLSNLTVVLQQHLNLVVKEITLKTDDENSDDIEMADKGQLIQILTALVTYLITICLQTVNILVLRTLENFPRTKTAYTDVAQLIKRSIDCLA